MWYVVIEKIIGVRKLTPYYYFLYYHTIPSHVSSTLQEIKKKEKAASISRQKG